MTTYIQGVLNATNSVGPNEIKAIRIFMLRSIGGIRISADKAVNRACLSNLFNLYDTDLTQLTSYIDTVNKKAVEGQNAFYQWKEDLIGTGLRNIER